MRQDGITLEVLVGGKSLREITHKGRTYVEALADKNFVLRVRNHSGRRAAVVPTVDGLSVMDGEPGSYGSGGYILSSYGSVDIPGFRLNNDEVANFIFGGKGASYAASKGEEAERNVGVIGLAAFHESIRRPRIRPQGDRWLDHPQEYALYSTRSRGGACGQSISAGTLGFCDASLPEPVQNVGTEFGEKANHSVHEVSFKREDSPFAVLSLYYDDREGLIEKGVLSAAEGCPDAFPVEPEPKGVGCTPPEGWNG